MTDVALTPVSIPPRRLGGDLRYPRNARGLVIFANGSGTSRFSPGNRHVAEALAEAGLATLLFDLLTESEAMRRDTVFNVDLLAGRVIDAIAWVGTNPALANLPIGILGSSTGGAAALIAAAARPNLVRAVVSRGGRPDLAEAVLGRVQTPSLLIVGENDEPVLTWNREAATALKGPWRLDVVPGATHLFEEAGALDQVIRRAADWFCNHLAAFAATGS